MANLYVIPFFLYLVGTAFAGRFEGENYPFAYAAVVVICSVWIFHAGWKVRASHPEALPRVHVCVLPGFVVGIVGIAIWIGVCHLRLEQHLTQFLPSFLQPEARVGFNPFEEIEDSSARAVFLAFRLIGIAIVVPIAEEFFWRGFLLRWLIDPEWEKVKLGEYTLASCSIVTLMFTVAHPEWFAAALWCAPINGLLYWKRDLWQCIVAHSVSNLLLVAYVLVYDQWYLW